ncbi:MAG: hypothetical protein LBE71_01740 [Dysgonamonadaceae bacterium]|jgi:hypothetical protein|nr:hypothetical protein [Dysgonamonadaceae bacterium]
MKSIFYYKSILCLCVLSLSFSAYPYEETNDVDVCALALGNVKALSRGLSNPAFLAFMERKELGASVYNRFMIKELNTASVHAFVPNRTIDASFLLSSYGYEDYRLLQVQAGLAKKLSHGFSIGTNLTYLNKNSILKPESKSYLSADVGLYYRINESFEAAFTAGNLLHTSSPFPVVYSAGVLYQLLPDCSILIEADADFGDYFEVKAGIEYEIAGQFSVRAGFKTQPKTPSIGFAYSGMRWKTEVAFFLHPVLGVSSAIGMAWFF